MKVVELSNKTYLVRHWLRWYRVQRSGGNWAKLAPIIKNGKPPKDFSIESAAESLKAKGSGSITPPIDLTD